MISVIIPVYNSEKTLAKCLDSVICQTYTDREIILVNDGSTDSSWDICKKYSSYDDKIRLFNISHGGVSRARNLGIDMALGPHIVFVDSDDIIPIDALKNLYQSADLVIGDFRKVIKGKHISSRNELLLSSDCEFGSLGIKYYASCYLDKPHLYPLFTYCWGKLYNRDIIKKHNITFNENLRYYEDVEFNFKYIKHIKNIYYVNKIVYNYHTGLNITKYSIDDYRNLAVVLETIRNYMYIYPSHYFITSSIIILLKLNDYELVRRIINDAMIRNHIKSYNPTLNDSRIIPVLIKLRITWLLVLFCKLKYKIYNLKRGL